MDWSLNFTSTTATLDPGGTGDTCINLLMRAWDYTPPTVDGECKTWTVDYGLDHGVDHGLFLCRILQKVAPLKLVLPLV